LNDIFEEIEAFPLSQIFYKEIRRYKGRGEHRIILVPSQELKMIQKRILRLLHETWSLNIMKIYGLYGLRKKGGCCVDHALSHSHDRWIFQFDIKNAFPSVRVSFLREILEKRIEKRFVDLIIDITTYKQSLPQGAPTSPFLFYLILSESGLFMELFKTIQSFSYRINLSCYVDDFVASSNSLIPDSLQKELLDIVRSYGFEINDRKTRFQDCRHGAVMITGISVDGTGNIRLPKKTIRKWRGLILKAIYTKDLALEKRIDGFISSLKPVYGKKIPSQILKPYIKL